MTVMQLLETLKGKMAQLGYNLKYTIIDDNTVVINCPDSLPYFKYVVIISNVHTSGVAFTMQYLDDSTNIILYDFIVN